MEAIFPVLLVLLVISAIFYSAIAHERRMNDLVTSWAASCGFRIVSCEKPWFRMGPYWLKSKSQTIFRVEVVDSRGRQRCAWLRCGSSFWSGDRVEVEWED